MKQTLTALAIAGMVGISNQAIAGPASATLGSSSPFSVSLFDLNPWDGISPGVSFLITDALAQASNPYVSDGGTVLPLLATASTGTYASLMGVFIDHTLELTANADGGGNWASSYIGGVFSLSPMTVLTIQAGAEVVATLAGDYAYASIAASGPGANGSGYQDSLSELFTHDSSLNGLLGISFVNLTGGWMGGQFYAYTYAYSYPIPEPETYALMLTGLGLVGWMARRRRA